MKKTSCETLVDKENGIRREISSEIVELELRNVDIKNTLAFGKVVVPNSDSDVVEIGSLVSLLFRDGEVDKVMIGTRCSILFDGDDEEEEIILVETIGGLNAGVESKYVSISSPLGCVLLGAKEGDELSYKVNGRTLKVKVMSIVSSFDDYMKPIRSVTKKKRRCYRSYQEEKLTFDKEALERLYALMPS